MIKMIKIFENVFQHGPENQIIINLNSFWILCFQEWNALHYGWETFWSFFYLVWWWPILLGSKNWFLKGHPMWSLCIGIMTKRNFSPSQRIIAGCALSVFLNSADWKSPWLTPLTHIIHVICIGTWRKISQRKSKQHDISAKIYF